MSKGTKDALEAVGRLLAVALLSVALVIILDLVQGFLGLSDEVFTRIIVCFVWARVIVYRRD